MKFSSLPFPGDTLSTPRFNVNMSSITTECSSCKKKFKTLYSLKKHATQHHEDVDEDAIIPVFKDSTGNEVELPQGRQSLNRERHAGYKMWLAGLIERLNSSFHPRFPGNFQTRNNTIAALLCNED